MSEQNRTNPEFQSEGCQQEPAPKLSNWPEWVNNDHALSDGYNVKMTYATYEALLVKNGDPLVAAILTVAWSIHRAAVNNESF